MSIIPPISPPAAAGSAEVDYPTSDGRPLAETPLHRDVLVTSIEVLDEYFAAEPNVYVSGNMLVYYEPGNKRKHVSPDVFVVRGVPKNKPRDYYLVWEEEHAPDIVIEITSKSTCDEDADEKMILYRDTLQVSEVYLFDPRAEYLDPPLQGYRLRNGRYERITAQDKRLASDVLGLHLETNGDELRFHDPAVGQWLPTNKEVIAAAKAQTKAAKAQTKAAQAQAKAAEAQAKAAESRAEVERRKRMDAQRRQSETQQQRAEEQRRADVQRQLAEEQQAENERLRREIELLKRGQQPRK
ncbi:MAG TPA: Uma2 family endonuclease [Pirellulales bacterium]|jgi:Uma2 family endonuclease|nr:Uma2 family endonuclease [Pirellulales bacterium]